MSESPTLRLTLTCGINLDSDTSVGARLVSNSHIVQLIYWPRLLPKECDSTPMTSGWDNP